MNWSDQRAPWAERVWQVSPASWFGFGSWWINTEHCCGAAAVMHFTSEVWNNGRGGVSQERAFESAAALQWNTGPSLISSEWLSVAGLDKSLLIRAFNEFCVVQSAFQVGFCHEWACSLLQQKKNFHLSVLVEAFSWLGAYSGNDWLSSIYGGSFVIWGLNTIWQIFLKLFKILLSTGESSLSSNTIKYFCCPLSATTVFPDLCCILLCLA